MARLSVRDKRYRAADWRIREIPHYLQVRRVEIVGPVDLKTIVKALNSGAKTFIAILRMRRLPRSELSSRVRSTSRIMGGEPRHPEARPGHVDCAASRLAHARETSRRRWRTYGGCFPGFRPLCVPQCAHNLKAGGTPAFYLPTQSHLEARLWRDVLAYTEFALGLPHGSLKATVLIETLPAAFEMDEILYELRDHIIGLSCGGWDAIFSTIKRVGKHARLLTPDRSAMVMSKAFLHAWSLFSSRRVIAAAHSPWAAWLRRSLGKAIRWRTKRHLRKFAAR